MAFGCIGSRARLSAALPIEASDRGIRIFSAAIHGDNRFVTVEMEIGQRALDKD
jgi:hypothetical protein